MENTVSNAVPAPLFVAIDGPAGSGKSSVSREAAARLGFGILDTGAAYRALAWAALESGIDLDHEDAVLRLMGEWRYSITMVGQQQVTVLLPGASDGERGFRTCDVTAVIREPAIASQVSRVSKHPRVREQLNTMFRELVATSGLPGVVVEGRDITTVVAPNAPVRLLLTASAEARAARRAGELEGFTHEQVLADLAARDAKDAQVVDFFTAAPGVTLIDTSDMSFDQVVRAVIDVVREAQTLAQKAQA